MSLTQIHDVFTSVHEDGLNDLIEAFYKSRTRYFIYGTPDFAPSTTATITSIPPISFPGIPGGIQFAVAFRQPSVDLHPDSSGGSAVLPPQAGQFSISANVILIVLCGSGKRDIDPTHGTTTDTGIVPTVEFTELEIHARGSINSDGVSIGFQVEEIEIVDITPDSLESVIECMMRMILNATLQNIRIPIPSLSLDAFSLTLTQGPTIEQDQIKVWGVI